MSRRRTYTDDELAAAVAASRSWRGVLRALGLAATSAGAMRSVRAAADSLGLDHSHFTGQRRWSDQELADAVSAARNWTQVADSLGLVGGSNHATLKGHAARLGLAIDHLHAQPRPRATADLKPDLTNLSRAGSLMAASWFALCGYDVSWPVEPCAYDLVVWTPEGAQRIQVKTTTTRAYSTWVAKISQSGRVGSSYDPEQIDSFFIIDGDLSFYLIPVAVVGGFLAIHVSAYDGYRVGSFGPLST